MRRSKPHLLPIWLWCGLWVGGGSAADPVPRHAADVCVYGGTASGVMAAVAAAKEGASVIIVEPGRWLGGMTGGGISNLDWGRRDAVGGSAFEILKGQPGNEVYRKVFKDLAAKHGIKVIYDHRLGKVQRAGSAICSMTLDHAPVDQTGCPIPEPEQAAVATIAARVFIDCTYEGDLMAMGGVSHTWGRESRQQYGESLAGVRPSLWVYDIDPYVEPGNPESGLIPHVQDREIGPLGSADKLTMGYCFRFKFAKDGEGIPVPEPKGYDPKEFELWRRGFQQGLDLTQNRSMKKPGIVKDRSNYFIGGGGNLSRALLTTTVYGCNAEYPDGDWAARAGIWKFHQEFFCKLLHFLRTEPSAPEKWKSLARTISFRRGVFDDTQGWPSQLYVREARRMVSAYVVTQKDMEGKTDPEHSIGLASYGVDDWPYATVVEDGKVALQGGEFSILYLDQEHNGIYKIPYESIIPLQKECDNLLVPVCCSASHIAMTSIRMEPVWMVLGESAGVAAAMAVQADSPVQEVPYDALRARLLELGQKLERPRGGGAARSPGRKRAWDSQEEWDATKRGYEWVFLLIDGNKDGKVSAAEYEAFQAFKKEHQADWEMALRQSGRESPAGHAPQDDGE
jgi:hypothetical protein